jgi:hypothetical protein
MKAKQVAKLFVEHNPHIKQLSAGKKKKLFRDICALLVGFSTLVQLGEVDVRPAGKKSLKKNKKK